MDRITLDAWKQEAFAAIQRAAPDIFPEFRFKRAGGYWVATQDAGQDAKGNLHYYDNSPASFFNMKTWEPVGVERFIGESFNLTGWAILEKMAALSGIALPQGATSERYLKEQATRQRRGAILEAALGFFRAQLKGSETEKYLRDGRGYKPAEIEAMGLGHNPGLTRTLAHLQGKGFAEAEIIRNSAESPDGALFRGMDLYRLVIPWADDAGRVTALQGRLLDSAAASDKYKWLSAQPPKDTPLNWHRARKAPRLVIVEAGLYALRMEANDIRGAAALGGKGMSESIQALIGLSRATEIVLCLDGEESGQTGMEKILLDGILSRWPDKRFLVASLPSSKDAKDPDAFIGRHGALELAERLETARPASHWMAERMTLGHNKGPAERQRALDRVVEFSLKLSRPALQRQYAEDAAFYIGEPVEVLEEEFRLYHLRKEEEARAEAKAQTMRQAQTRLADASRAFQEGDEAGGREILQDLAADLRAKSTTRAIQVYTVDHLLQDVKEGRPGLKTGFKSLDTQLSVSLPYEAVTIVAGRPSHGKTSLLLNLLLNAAQAEPDRVFPFFSYEETPKQLALKLFNIMGGYKHLDGMANLSHIESYLKTGKDSIPQWNAARDKLRELTNPEAPRILIVETTAAAGDLVDSMAHLAAKYPLGGVFVDYIQKIKFNGKADNRTIELKKVSERILEGAKGLHLPIALGAQLGRDKETEKKGAGNGGEPSKTKPGRPVRLDNLRECGDIEQDANLVLGLHNSAFEKAEAAGTKANLSEPVDVTVTVLKNRNGGGVNRYVTLEFNGAINTFKDKGAADEW